MTTYHFIAASERLKPKSPLGRKAEWLAGQVRYLRIILVSSLCLHQAIAPKQAEHMRLACLVRLCLRRRLRNILLHKIEIEQPVGVVEGRSEDLTPGNILESRRDAAGAQHRTGINRPRAAEAGQGRPEGADQEGRLNHVAAGLFYRERCKLAVKKRMKNF